MTADEALFEKPLADDGDPAPLYMRLQKRIREVVRAGQMSPRASLPPERVISERMQLSRVTVRRALENLVQEGLLTRRQGSGTFVADPPPRVEQALSRLSSFSEDMRQRGLEPSSVWLSRDVTLPSPSEAMQLHLFAGERIVRLRRMRLANGVPMAIETAMLAERDLPNPNMVQASLYEALDRLDLTPVRALQRLASVNLNETDAASLGIAAGAAGLKIERVSFLASGRPVEFTTSLYRGDAYDFITELVGR
jgi:GntR family transcriptional regulator